MGTVMRARDELAPGNLRQAQFSGEVSLYVPVGAYAGEQRRCAGFSHVIWLDVLPGELGAGPIDDTVWQGVRDPSDQHAVTHSVTSPALASGSRSPYRQCSQ